MAHPPILSRLYWPALILAAAALILAAISLDVAVQSADSEATPFVVPTATPVPTGAMWSLGTGGWEGEPYHEWVAVYPTSTLWNILGAPSLRLFDHAPSETGYDRSFEIGFYKYGPTLYTANHIVEFWIGDGEDGGTLSVIGNDGTGGQLEVRNPTDTDHISLDYRQADRPRIRVDKNPLYLAADGGLVSESPHTFARGFDVPPQSGHAGQVREGWLDGAVTVPTRAVNAESLVLITPLSEPRGRWWVSAITAGESFTVHSTAPDEDMVFNWLLIN
ncbi:MAG: hypothetical protein OZ934_06980 [Anaerolineae bacterium]|nr:hypothetical protein [Anaerolineae bacterium]